MSKKNKVRYLKRIVVFCIAFPCLVVAAGLFVCWRRGFDPTGIVAASITFFGVELGLSCLTKIFDDKGKKEKEQTYDE